MMRVFPMLLPWILLTGLPLVAQTSPLEPVWRAELSFARMAGEKGIRAAFLSWLTEDASVYTPRRTTANESYGPEPGDPGHLAWYPEDMGIAASGEWAWSFGPWTYAAKKGEAPLAQGHFLSMWHRQADGQWKVESDIGVPHAPPESAIKPFVVPDVVPAASTGKPEVPDATAAIHKKEAALAAVWAEKGGLALWPLLAKGARVLRPKSPPLSGEGARKALALDSPGSTWEAARIRVARSGDLAWTCGETGRDEQGRRASFFHLWTLESGEWKVLFDARLTLPPLPR
jgi:hypothetical protein